MKIKEQTRKLAAGCSKYSFEVVDRTDEVSNHTYGKATLTWFEFDFRRVLGEKEVNLPTIKRIISSFFTPDIMRFSDFKDFFPAFFLHMS